jgi:hypothetical protein
MLLSLHSYFAQLGKGVQHIAGVQPSAPQGEGLTGPIW